MKKQIIGVFVSQQLKTLLDFIAIKSNYNGARSWTSRQD